MWCLLLLWRRRSAASESEASEGESSEDRERLVVFLDDLCCLEGELDGTEVVRSENFKSNMGGGHTSHELVLSGMEAIC